MKYFYLNLLVVDVIILVLAAVLYLPGMFSSGDDVGGGPGLRPGQGGKLAPLSGLTRLGSVVGLITNTDQVSLGSSTPGSTFDLSVEDQGTATGTIYASSVFGTRGGCIQLEGPGSTTFFMYATTTNTPAVWTAGTCR